MKIRVSAVIVASVSGMLLGGCVTSGTYQAKEQERQQLSRNLEEIKTSYTELKEKYGKLDEASNELSAKLKRISAEAVEMKLENVKVAEVNNEQSVELKKLAAESAGLKLANKRLAEENIKQSENLKMISADFVELKLENAKLLDALKPENILKSLAENFKMQKQKIEALSDENVKMKQELIAQPKMQPVESQGEKAPAKKIVIESATADAKKELTPEPTEGSPAEKKEQK